MSASGDFLGRFDEQGRYNDGDGVVPVVFLTKGGSKYPGVLRFRGGLLVGAEIGKASPWCYPDGSALDGLKFLLSFPGEQPRAVCFEQGRLAHGFEPRDRDTKGEFLANFRLARNLFAHPRVEGDNSTVSTADIAGALARAALWLTPKAVEGFRAGDFSELPPDRLTQLEQAVESFRAVTGQVPDDKPPTPEQYGAAEVAFRTLLGILQPYFPNPEESRKVEAALRKVPFPPWVVTWDFELGSDEDGGAAVWVHVYTRGDTARGEYGRLVSRIVPQIRQALAAEGVRRWPYVRLHTALQPKTA